MVIIVFKANEAIFYFNLIIYFNWKKTKYYNDLYLVIFFNLIYFIV